MEKPATLERVLGWIDERRCQGGQTQGDQEQAAESTRYTRIKEG
jgi:hypothetical protein